jgi:hypothetical protein
MPRFRPLGLEHTPVADDVVSTEAGRWLDRLTRWAPALWLLGLLHASVALWLLITPLRNYPRSHVIHVLVGLWLAVGLLQAVSALLNGVWLGDWALGLRHALSINALGWLFAGWALAAGASLELAGVEAARLFARLGAYTLGLGVITLLGAAIGVLPDALPTPPSAAAPGSEVLRQYAGVKFFHEETTLGATTTRLVLMYPWAPALGVGSLGLTLVSSRCAHSGWRWAGMLGGLVGVIFSWSRLAQGAAMLAFAALFLLRAAPTLRWSIVLPMMALASVLILFGTTPVDLMDSVYGSVNNVRAGSSLARDLIIEESWAAFLRSPWIGYGWVGESVHPIENLPIGSHSTLYGTLYTGGLLVFVAFAAALLGLLASITWRLVRETDIQRRKDLQVAWCLGMVLLITARYESLYSLSLPCYFYFVWMGMALSPAAHQPSALDAPVLHRNLHPRHRWRPAEASPRPLHPRRH